MTKPRILPGLVLCGVLLAACATATVAPAQPTVVEPSDTPSLIPTAKSTLSVDLTATYTLELLSATPAVHAQPVATSRGPELHATDPTTVSLAAGQLQLVEFFRFTWGTCRAMAPMVHGLEAKYFGSILFTYLDADDSRTHDFQSTLGFYYQPELYLLDANGNVLQKWVGFTTQEELEAAFAEYLK